MNQKNYLDILNPEQLTAVTHSGCPLLILAGAGSGKTRVITTKIAYLIDELGVSPYSILAVTFTKKAASEMHERAIRLTEAAQFAQIRTFHSFGSWFLRLYAKEAELSTNFTVYDDDDAVTLVSKACPDLTRVQAAQAAHKIARAKDYCLTWDSAGLSFIDSAPDFADIYQKYQERLKSTGNVDFGDLIMLPTVILKNNPQIRSHMHHKFKVILVDEYQDSNVAQFELLQQLAGAQSYLCVVGDDDQSIYRFRGAEVKNILTFQEHFNNTTLIRLERNYRSVSPILSAADRVVSNNTGRLGKTLLAERGTGKKPTLVFTHSQDDESAFCAELIEKSYSLGCPYSDWAILYRTNAQSLNFETEFLQRKIPYRVVGSLKFYDREEIKDILAYLALIANNRNEIAFERIINKPARALGNVTQKKITDEFRSKLVSQKQTSLPENQQNQPEFGILDACKIVMNSLPAKAKKGLSEFLHIMTELIDEIDSAPPLSQPEELANSALFVQNAKKNPPKENLVEFIQKIIEKSLLHEYYTAQDEIAGTQRAANMDELANSAALYPKNRAGLTQFLDHIELDRAAAQETENTDAVTLITLHNTKGLEFPRVIITGLEQGIFPREDKSGEELEEERRLFYVGITRAKDELYITSCSIRRLYGKTAFMEPSRFLSELDLENLDIVGTKPPLFGRQQAPNFATHKKTEQITHPLAQKWHIGKQVFHDDFGYGVISKHSIEDGEFVICVAFETSDIQKFLPEHHAKSLMAVN